MGTYEERKANSAAIESAISDLESDYHFPGFMDAVAQAFSLGFVKPDFPEFHLFWARVKEINEMFKESPPLREDRDELRNRVSRLCEQAKEAQQWERDNYNRACDENRNEIEHALRDLEFSHDLDWISDWVSRPKLKGFWSDVVVVKDMFREKKPLRKSDRENLWEHLDRICEKAKACQDRISSEWERRQDEYRDRLYERKQKIEEILSKNEDAIRRFQDRISENEERRDNARSEDFADTVQGWIDELEGKISDIEARNRELHESLSEVEDKLDRT